MILAAGRGKRLRPLTDHTPKPLIEVGGRPLIEHHLAKLASAGVREVVVNLGYLGEQIAEAMGDGGRFGLHLTYSREEDPPLETGGGIKAALPLLGAAPFLLINADVYTDLAFAPLLQRGLRGDELAHLVMVPNPPQHPDGDFCLQAGRLSAEGRPRLTYSGIAMVAPALVADVPELRFALAPCLRRAMATGQVSGQCHRGVWDDIGTLARLQQLRTRLAAPGG